MEGGGKGHKWWTFCSLFPLETELQPISGQLGEEKLCPTACLCSLWGMLATTAQELEIPTAPSGAEEKNQTLIIWTAATTASADSTNFTPPLQIHILGLEKHPGTIPHSRIQGLSLQLHFHRLQ